MKNRKTVVVAFLLVAALLLGVGYAELTDTLHIAGTAGADTSVAASEFNQDVHFGQMAAGDYNFEKVDVSITSDGDGDTNDKAVIVAEKFTVANEQQKITLTIVNTSTEFDAQVTISTSVNVPVTPTGTGEAHEPIFEAAWEWKDGTTGAKTIAAGGNAKIVVTITMTETPTEAHQATFAIDLDAVAVPAAALNP